MKQEGFSSLIVIAILLVLVTIIGGFFIVKNQFYPPCSFNEISNNCKSLEPSPTDSNPTNQTSTINTTNVATNSVEQVKTKPLEQTQSTQSCQNSKGANGGITFYEYFCTGLAPDSCQKIDNESKCRTHDSVKYINGTIANGSDGNSDCIWHPDNFCIPK